MARHFTVYAVNRKPGLPPGSTIRDLAGDDAEVIGREFPGPVAVWGISTGGSIAQQFAIDHPQLVRRLVLAATAAGGRGCAAQMWLFGGSQRPDDPSDMLVTVAAEDGFDASSQLHRITFGDQSSSGKEALMSVYVGMDVIASVPRSPS